MTTFLVRPEPADRLRPGARAGPLSLSSVSSRTAPLGLADLDSTARRAEEYATRAKSPHTRRAYGQAWRSFAGWCADHGLEALPAAPGTLALYLTERIDQGASISALSLAWVAIGQAHDRGKHPNPRSDARVRDVWAGIRRAHGVAPKRQASPLDPKALRLMINALPEGLLGLRDRALLLVGFAGGFRRSELVSLDISDVREDPDGYVITLRRSKTDQEGIGREVGIPYGSDPKTCPTRALARWLETLGRDQGPLFPGLKGKTLLAQRLSGQAVERIVRRSAKRAGVQIPNLSGHSLRAGLVTASAKAGKPAHVIMAQTGHRSLAMVQRYIRGATLFEDNAAAGIGL